MKLTDRKDGYLPPSKAYELVDLAQDLVQLARYLLVPGGRLVFFLPTISDEFEHVDVPVVEGMREIKFGDGSVQDFGRWGRRLITMEKTAQDDGPPPTFGDHSDLIGEDRVPAHHQFAKRVSIHVRRGLDSSMARQPADKNSTSRSLSDPRSRGGPRRAPRSSRSRRRLSRLTPSLPRLRNSLFDLPSTTSYRSCSHILSSYNHAYAGEANRDPESGPMLKRDRLRLLGAGSRAAELEAGREERVGLKAGR